MDQGLAGRTQRAGRQGRQWLKRSTTVSLFTGLGVVAGFAVDLLIVARFGLGAGTDAFFAAYTVPFILVTGLAAVGPVLVSVLAGEVHDAPESDATAFNALLFSTGLVALVMAGLGVWLARPVIALTAPGFDPDSAALASLLAQILFLRVPFAAASEVCKAELYARQRFAMATFSNSVPSLVTVGFLLAAGARTGIQAAAWGLALGALVQAALLSGVLFGLVKVPFRPRLRQAAPLLRRTAVLVLAPLAGVLLRQAVTLTERILGSFLPAGSLTALSYANRLTMIVAGVSFDGLTTAALPSLAEGWSKGSTQAARAGLGTLLKMVATIALPLGLAVAALSVPLARLFFERGQVAAQQAMLLGSVWGVYALSLPFLGPYRVVQTFFYSVREAKPAVVLHATLAASSVALDLVLVWSLGATGLALSFVLSCSLVTVIGLIWMARSAGDPSHPSGEGLNWRRLAGSAWRLGFVSAAMAAALLATSKGLDPLVGGAGHWGLALNLGVSALSGAAVFVGLGAILHLEAVVVAWKVVKEKWLVGTQPGY